MLAPQARHCGAKMEAVLVCNSMEKGGIFCGRHGPWIGKKGASFGSQPPWILNVSTFFHKKGVKDTSYVCGKYSKNYMI